MSSVPDQHGFDFAELVRAQYEGLYRFAYSLAKNPADASDLVQQTFLIFAQKGASLRDRAKIKSWLFTTLYREFLRQRRRGGHQTTAEPEVLENMGEVIEPTAATALDSHQAVEALQQVDEVYRAPLAMFYLEDLTYQEIADALEIPIGTVMSRLSRGKAQLRKVLADGNSARAKRL